MPPPRVDRLVTQSQRQLKHRQVTHQQADSNTWALCRVLFSTQRVSGSAYLNLVSEEVSFLRLIDLCITHNFAGE